MTGGTRVRLMTWGISLLLAPVAPVASVAFAQQPPQPAEIARSVTLSLAEYNRLIDLAGRPAPEARVPPVAAVLASADLRVRVEGDGARGVFQLTGDVLRAGVHRVHLVSSATLVAATTAGRPLPLVAEGQAHAALLSGPAPFSVSLEWGTPLALRPGRASFVLPVPAAGTARATIDLARRTGRRSPVLRSCHASILCRWAHDRGGDARSRVGDRSVVVAARQRACGCRARSEDDG